MTLYQEVIQWYPDIKNTTVPVVLSLAANLISNLQMKINVDIKSIMCWF